MEKKEIRQYIDDVASGKVKTSKYFILQCQRHINDLEQRDDLKFVEEEAIKHINFMTKVARHTKDRWAGKLFEAQPFQFAMHWMLFGWHSMSADLGEWVRRYRTLYFDIARKNGKTEYAATLANDMFITGPYGTEIYASATKREQAMITFKVARAQMMFMQRYSSRIRRDVKVKSYNMEKPSQTGLFQPVSSDHQSLDGLNPLVGIVDEYHAHKTDQVLSVLETGMGSRWNPTPMLIVTTTAGFNKDYPCYAFRQNAIKMLEGQIEDDFLLPFIFAMDDEEEWEDPENWYKSNPNLGVSVSLDYLKGQYQKAVNEGPSKKRQFITKNLNMWVDADEVWIEPEVWIANGKLDQKGQEKLLGRKCYGAIDISSVRDLTSIALAFPPQSGVEMPSLIVYHFCPEARVKELSRKGYKHGQWVKEGWLIPTKGNVIDYDMVRQTLIDCKQKYRLREVAFDRWGAQHVITPLVKTGLKFIEHGQGFASMNEPTKAFERDVYDEHVRIEHFGNPVLEWEVRNAMKREDPAGNIKPDKQHSNGQIDGVVASIMAWGLMKKGMAKKSAYSDRGIRTLG